MVDRDHELGLLVNALHRSLRDRAAPQVVTSSAGPASARAGCCASCTGTPAELVDDAADLADRALPAVRRERHVRRAGRHRQGRGRHPGHRPGRQRGAAAGRRRRRAGRPGRARPGWPTRCGPLVGLPGTPLPAEEAESAWRRFLLALAARRPHRAGLRGPALGRRRDAPLRRAARRGRPRACRCWCSAPPGRSWSTGDPSLGRHHHRLGDHLAAAAARHRHRHPVRAPVRPGGVLRRHARPRSSRSPTATRSTPTSTSGC